MTLSGAPGNNLYQLLSMLATTPDEEGWVSASVLTKHRSSYRKPGAMMLVSPLGQMFGLISGGCLESDILVRARRVLQYGRPEYVIYDSTEDGNIAAELGLGCNGRIGVVVEELTAAHRALYRLLLERMEKGLCSTLVHCLHDDDGRPGLKSLLDDDFSPLVTLEGPAEIPSSTALQTVRGEAIEHGEALWSVVDIKPPVRLLIAGGGIDARPVAELAVKLGWRVTVADHRTVNARPQNFPGVESLINVSPSDLSSPPDVDAVVIMSHNLDIDARWLKQVRHMAGVAYLGLLGPVARKEEVFALAGVEPESEFARRVHGPMGLDIGGDLPEAVAVSVIAECHQVLARSGYI